MPSSVMSVGTFDAFFGQLTQMKPAGASSGRAPPASPPCRRGGDEDMGGVDRRLGRGEQVERQALALDLGADAVRHVRPTRCACPSFSDSFLASGVPE